ncbi:MAG: 50S ribosomal protein L24, partial [Candidatus Thermoplasmatota archaeon]|nr:50S ribosomal protein L24 [Candidatus Thermoplasmatota archaeon]
MKSRRPGKQRKILFNAPLHKKRKWLASHLEENLLLKYDRRSVPLIKGDTVRVMRGNYRGHEDKVAKVDVKSGYVEVEGTTITKADGKKIPKLLHASNLLITKLNLADKWRRAKLEKGLPEETKKEIEREAEQQLRDAEEQKRKEEEKKKIEEARQKTLE